MYKLNDEEFVRLKQIELKILLEVDKVCREHDIKYSLAWGTLIGAVRHQGFIPWDDDIDIMMERKYYDKFVQVVDQSLSADYEFVDYLKYNGYGLPFPKVIAKNTLMLEVSSRLVDYPHGIWVDVFPIDETTDDLKERERQYATAQRIKSIMLCRGHYDFGKTGLDQIVYDCRRLIYRLRSKQSLTAAFESNAKQFAGQHGKYMLSLCGNAGVAKNTYERSLFQNYIELDFEGHKLLSIEGYDRFLRTTYGDYMKLPPPEEQVAHHYVEQIQFSI